MKKILVILSPGFEETEAITVIDILRRAKLNVTTASLEPNQTVLGSHNIAIIADQSLNHIINSAISDFDAIALPGGMKGVENMLNSDALVSLVNAFYQNNKLVAAVCAAPLVLQKAGILEGHKFTCHPCVFDRITTQNRCETAAVADKTLVTGRSCGCALPWAIELVRVLTGSVDDIMPGLAMV